MYLYIHSLSFFFLQCNVLRNFHGQVGTKWLKHVHLYPLSELIQLNLERNYPFLIPIHPPPDSHPSPTPMIKRDTCTEGWKWRDWSWASKWVRQAKSWYQINFE